MYIPEPPLTPPEAPDRPLRCCLCLRRVPEALELPYGIVCPACLIDRLTTGPLDNAAALLCAAVLEDTL